MNLKHNLSDNIFTEEIEKKKMRDGAGIGVREAGKKHDDIVVLSADTAGSARASYFAEEFPERFIECGVAEQNMIGLSAGLAYQGKVSYPFTYASFLIGRAWEPIRTTIAYPNNHAVLVSSHAGLATGPDGPTHQMTEDIALMRSLPNFSVICPADFEQAKKAAQAAYKLDGPVYIRTSRPATEAFTTEDTSFEVGKAQVLKEGTDLTAIGHGYPVYRLLQVAKELEDEIDIEVINLHTIKPLDKEAVLKSAQKTEQVFTVEDHQIAGGMGSAVSELLAQENPVPMKLHGVQDEFAESGSPEAIWDKYGLDKDSIKVEIKQFTN
ncbi:MAG: transketolase family protein [Candidatus Magasanikbacteria bacterium]